MKNDSQQRHKTRSKPHILICGPTQVNEGAARKIILRQRVCHVQSIALVSGFKRGSGRVGGPAARGIGQTEVQKFEFIIECLGDREGFPSGLPPALYDLEQLLF